MQEDNESCKHCGKILFCCVCEILQPVQNTKRVLILQHPQEPDKELGTATLVLRALENSTLKIGLSWRNLRHAAGDESLDPKRWVAMYLGSVKPPREPGVFEVKKDASLSKVTNAADIDGVVFLDGTWSQAKALWWRNAWLLKLRRAILVPTARSAYGKFRREPRPECVSTLECVTETMFHLGESPDLMPAGRNALRHMLEQHKKKY